jgi:hypothetical protein
MRNKTVPMASCEVQDTWPWDIIDLLNREINTGLGNTDRGRRSRNKCYATCAEFADVTLGFLRVSGRVRHLARALGRLTPGNSRCPRGRYDRPLCRRRGRGVGRKMRSRFAEPSTPGALVMRQMTTAATTTRSPSRDVLAPQQIPSREPLSVKDAAAKCGGATGAPVDIGA